MRLLNIKTYNGLNNDATFYIQAKGLHSGRPLYKPIKNCFAVYSDSPLLFAFTFALWKGRCFEPFIGGSVIPFIRLADVRKILTLCLDEQKNDISKELTTIQKIDELLKLKNDQISHLKQLQIMTARKAVNAEKLIRLARLAPY
jgi:hypothetical protein